MKSGKLFSIIGIALLALFIFVYVGSKIFSPHTSTHVEIPTKITDKNKGETLTNLYKSIHVNKENPVKGQVDLNPEDVASELPDINKFPVSVKNTTSDYIEIFSSTEKSGTGTNGWINDVANNFNKAGISINGKPVSVKIRNIASGTATDYIRSGKYVPEAFTPSNELWGEIVKSSGVPTQLVSKRLAGNVPGLVISKSKYDELQKKYGKVNIQTVTDAMAKNEFAMGYTDPFASSTGLNFLITALNTFDSADPLSQKAVQAFESFQSNVPFTAQTTLQMSDAAKSGSLDGFVLEEQSFVNSPELKGSYVFTPFGQRHDSPLYALGNLSDEKKAIIQKFAEFTQQDQYQSLAKQDGFNYLDDYKSPDLKVNGETIASAQKLWKEKKNEAKPIAAVFVADVSGSMGGQPISQLKESLLKGQKYLGRNNSIGLISYSDDVTINLPIAKYDINQQANFVGAVKSLQDGGGTATNDALIVAVKMLENKMKTDKNVKPVIFLLTDGEQNVGHSLSDIKGLVKAYKIPIYTIGYNDHTKELKDTLQSIANINEADRIDADTDDVVYKIKGLLNVQM